MTFVGITDGGIFQSIFRRRRPKNRADSKPRVVVVEKNHETTILFFRPRKKTRGKETTIRFSWPRKKEKDKEREGACEKRFTKKALRNWGAKNYGKKVEDDTEEEGAQKELRVFFLWRGRRRRRRHTAAKRRGRRDDDARRGRRRERRRKQRDDGRDEVTERAFGHAKRDRGDRGGEESGGEDAVGNGRAG